MPRADVNISLFIHPHSLYYLYMHPLAPHSFLFFLVLMNPGAHSTVADDGPRNDITDGWNALLWLPVDLQGENGTFLAFAVYFSALHVSAALFFFPFSVAA